VVTENIPARKSKIFDVCPHCGKELSPWEKVLLSVDRALVCKRCWYRIILDTIEKGHEENPEATSQTEGRGK